MEIDGIAKNTPEAMLEIDIHSYAGLALYLRQRTAEEVSASLKEHGVNRPSGLIHRETRLRQDEVLSKRANAAPTPSEEETELAEKAEESLPRRESREHDAMFAVHFDVATDGNQWRIGAGCIQAKPTCTIGVRVCR